MSISTIIWKRLEMQGFEGDRYDPTFVQVVPWLLFTPILGIILVGWATVLASPLFFFWLASLALFGAITGIHPADFIYNYGIRYGVGTPPLPKNPIPRRFGFGVMAVALTVTGWLFLVGATLAGYILGTALLSIPFITITVPHFCVLSWLYRVLFGYETVSQK
ncbi:MAG: DUF4395 family protein [Anaerolineae bacterium]|nr:DUF4395 family protein [Anaerolineae bacterium]